MFVAMTLAAFYHAWLAWSQAPLQGWGYYPGIVGILSMLLAAAAPVVAIRTSNGLSGWSLIVIAIQFTCYNIVKTVIKSFDEISTTDGRPPTDWTAETLIPIVINSVTLPLFVLLPAVLYLLSHQRDVSRRTTILFVSSTLVCILSTAVAMGVVSSIVYRIAALEVP